MKMKTRIIAFLLLICMMVSMLPLTAIAVFASGDNTEEKEDATVKIEEGLSSYIQGGTQSFDNDGYIGIPYEITVYYDASKGSTKSGYNGTPVILYIVNSMGERLGTETDVNIIKSMLDRGYIVAVLDYLNNAKAVSPGLEYSIQKIRTKLRSGIYFKDKTLLPGSDYHENHAVPAGHNVRLNEVFYEIDKHGADGTIERIVHVWNEDFKAVKRDVIIKWVDEDGNRKPTERLDQISDAKVKAVLNDGKNPVEPTWYADAAGKTVDNENGQYVKIMYTKAMSITDCVKKDGTPIDYNLYMHVIYPDKPESDVPVLTLAGSSEHLAMGTYNESRPYLVGYALNGYAVATFDFEYVPMSRNDHYGYFSGDQSTGVTGQNGTFALGSFNRSNYNTAAIRYLRYLSITDHDTFKFDNDKFGLYGNSKGGFQTFLGAEALRESATVDEFGGSKAALEAYVDKKVSTFLNDAYIGATDPVTGIHTQYDGNSRYNNGKTEDIVKGSYVVDGGEMQPWLTYTDENGVLREIPSGVQWVYSSCGGTTIQPWENHSPVFTAANYYDNFGSGYSTHNYLENIFRIYDIPSLFFEAPLQHDIISGLDVNYGVDGYDALFKHTAYYLKDTPVSVVYTIPANNDAGVRTTDDITIRFYGPVAAEEIAKVVIKDENGNVAKGEWKSGYGKTQWTFSPVALNGGVKYTVTIPASLEGDNGKEMGVEDSFTFYTKGESTVDYEITTPVTVTNANGTYFKFTVPASLTAPNNTLKLRFKVSNNAANVANIYKASSASDTAGTLIGSINLKGEGYYEYDVTDYVMSKTAGEDVYFLVKAAKASADTEIYAHDFETIGDFSKGSALSTPEFVTEVAGEAVTAIKVYNKGIGGWYPVVLSNNKIINDGKAVTEDDYGRTFTVKIRIYDTVSRPIQLWFNDCTNGSETTADYSYTRTATHTVANEWIEISVPYTVYEMDYGVQEQIKQFKLVVYSTGGSRAPYYIDSFSVTEHVTDIEISEASLVTESIGDDAHKAPANEEKPVSTNGTAYTTWWDAVSKTNGTITFNSDYDFSHSSDGSMIAAISNLTVDLNGYTIRLSDKGFLNFASHYKKDTVNYTIKNGTIIVDDAPVINHLRAGADVAEKIYNITFDNVYITTTNGAATKSIITSPTSPDGTKITQNITFNDCVIDINRRDLPKCPATLFSTGTGNISTSYTFNGGSIIVSSTTKLTLWENGDSVYFKADENGEFTDVITAEASAIPAEPKPNSDKGPASFAVDKVVNGWKSYEVTGAKYGTAYGVIPDDKDPETYPFAVFTNGELIGVYTKFSSDGENGDNDYALYAAWQHFRGEHNNEVQIVLRRDYDMSAGQDTAFPNFSQIGGKLVIDLNGNTFTAKEGISFISLDSKYGYHPNWSGTNATNSGNHIYPTEVVVKGGGEIVTNGSPVIYYASMTKYSNGAVNANVVNRYDKQKVTDILFDGVTLDAKSTLISTNDTRYNEDFGALCNVTFNNCDIDISRISGASTLFDGYDNGSMNDLTVKINGGNITASQIANITLSKLNTDDTLVFGADASGKYTTLTMPTSAELAVFGGINDKGEAVDFGNGVVSGDNTVYSLKSSTLVTKYGTIPSEYADATAYPFAIFTNGQFVQATNLWCCNDNFAGYGGNATNCCVLGVLLKNLRGDYDAQYQILLRSDYDISSDGNKQAFNNFGQIGGEWVLDLGGNKLSASKSGYNIFGIQGKYGYDNILKKNHVYPSSIIVKNGTIDTASAAIKASSTISMVAEWDKVKVASMTFDDVIFNVPWGGVLETTTTAHSEKGLDLTLTFNNCEFNLKSNNATIFNGVASTINNRVDVIVNGGKINVKGYTGVTIANLPASEDTLTFGKGANGYPEYVSTKAGAPAGAFNTTENGAVYFGRYSAPATHGGTEYTYRLGESTEYGVIPYDYTANKYPFAVFSDGELVGVYEVLIDNNDNDGIKYDGKVQGVSSAFEQARAILVGRAGNAQILMRRDYTINVAKAAGYTNFSHLDGEFILDLNGKTLTHDSTNPLFSVEAKQSYNYYDKVTYVPVSNITVKNGTLITKAALIRFSVMNHVNYNNANAYKVINYVFKDLNVVYKNATYTALVAFPKTSTTGYNTVKQADFNITLNNCTLDASAITAASLPLVIGKDPDANLSLSDVNVVINGGKIITNKTVITAGTFNEIVGENGDSLKFGAYDGAYTVFTGTNLPTDTFTTVDGYGVKFEKVGDIYTLVPNEFKIIGAYLNIDENINVCYTVVLPTGYENPYMVFEFNGNTYTVKNYEIKDGKYIFKFVGVTPQMMGDNIRATVYANGGDVSCVKAEYSVREYCVSMLAKTSDTALKTLLTDLLIYGAKSQLYIGYKSDALVTEGVDLGSASTFTELNKSDMALVGTANTSVTWKSAALRYENAMAMKFTFKADANLVLKVTINGRTTTYNVSGLKADEDTGYYTVYFRGILATEYDDVVTAAFYNGDTQVGQSVTYSVNSYVKSKQGDSNEALAELVKATYNYGRAAELYVGQ